MRLQVGAAVNFTEEKPNSDLGICQHKSSSVCCFSSAKEIITEASFSSSRGHKAFPFLVIDEQFFKRKPSPGWVRRFEGQRPGRPHTMPLHLLPLPPRAERC